MQGVMWLVLLCCLAYLTGLLLVPNPLWLVGTRDEPPELLCLLMRVTHLLSVFVLTVFALITRWLVPRRERRSGKCCNLSCRARPAAVRHGGPDGWFKRFFAIDC